MSKSKIDYRKLILHCEGRIRSGEARLVAQQIAGLNLQAAPRSSRLPLANICRRIGLVSHGLRLLAPVIRPTSGRKVFEPPTPAELSEYAVLLLRKGASREAGEILDKVGGAIPEALLFKSFYCFQQWEYRSAIPLLSAYLNADLAPYARLVGKVNMIAALIGDEQFASAEALLDEVHDSIRNQPFGRLHGNCLELRAQIEILRDDPAKALALLEEAESLLNQMQTLDRFYVRKWKRIATGVLARDLRPLAELKAEATALGDWESVREADRFLLRISRDPALFEHLMFGTPHAPYRQRILRDAGLKLVHDEYLWGSGGRAVLNLVNPAAIPWDELLEQGKCLELIEVLARDFYAPATLGRIFAELWPGEYFDVFHSPTRVHQIVYRTRQILEAARLPFTVQEERGKYSLRQEGAEGGIRVPFERRSLGGYRREYEQLARVIPLGQEFKAREAREVLRMPRATFQRFSQWAEREKLIERQGQGPATVYKICA